MPSSGLRGVLLDMDGVLYHSGQLIPGAAETVGWLREQGIPALFLSNTSSRSRAALVARLGEFGIPARVPEILTPAIAAVEWLSAHAAGPVALFVPEAARADFDALPLLPHDAEQGAAAVVIGDMGDLWDYRTLNRAFRLLHHNPEAALVALGMTRYWLAPEGLSLDVGPFVAALESATGRRALVFGKPAPEFFHAACRLLGVPAEQIAMVGDDVVTDVGAAQAAGLNGVLVQTGKFRESDLDGSVSPTAVLPSIASLPDWWRSWSTTD